ncbi:DapH/DapD/GlmU-related protein [Pseudomonas wenzhouensis]|uniref:DapH/DapD/GlmU-related protein n=1 Tax=Pseudomonas wenzhouensis TaxID=2906062 RepID=UPI0023DFEE32|nr:DapH/DapD/GlmU-related protein [Pseudomonas wenzhouensis]UFQ99161.1 acetyltransferase [Pseudomonas wenzhouensis]
MRGYGFFTFIYLLFSKVSTLLISPQSRLIRIPFFIRNKNNISFGRNLTTGVGCRIDAFVEDADETKIYFGDNVQINDYVHIASMEKVVIGNNVLIASKVFISDHNHGGYSGDIHSSPLTAPASRPIISSPVIIEDNVWIGEFVSVLPGVTIGKGAVIGANSVVTTDIPANSIAVGAPARVIKRFDFEISKWVRV